MQASSILILSCGFFLYFLSWTAAAAAFAESAKPGCSTKCGELTVPYPFGIGINSNCSINHYFDMNCNASSTPPKAFLSTSTLEVLSISDTTINIKNNPAVWRYDHKYPVEVSVVSLLSSPFSLSNKNKLTVVGCDASATLLTTNDEDVDPISSCSAICSSPGELNNGSCSGIGCCQSSIPEGVQLALNSLSRGGHKMVHNFSFCSYSFLADQRSYIFDVFDISNPAFASKIIETVPVAIEWVIGSRSCNQIGNTSELICQQNSVCVDSSSGLGGYRCRCSQGYQGNPYLNPGCQDINECDLKPCHQDATCTNLPGTFNCSCRFNYIGDGTKHGTGCIDVSPPTKVALAAGLATGVGLSLMLVLSLWMYKLLKKRRIKQLRQNMFERNGGLLLQQQKQGQDFVLEKMRIFTWKELEKATDEFNASRILGEGGQGTVFTGMLSDGRIVAVKKSKKVNQNQVEEFINEVVVLSQVNHRNVVKLLGCCLEAEVPLLVYEFIPNGTLYHLIHDHETGIPFSWDVRLRIAAEVGNALAYLHHAASVPIFHRDMKSTNILLDENYIAKLSDFGISRSVEIDQTHLTTKVKGTFGYLDPEYFRTGQFTEKSDVYSFGVVLVELLTGQKPIGTGESETEEVRSLASSFLLAMEENRLEEILDCRISENSSSGELMAVSRLAKRCLNLKRKKRPSIQEVAMELESIRACEEKFWFNSKHQNLI